MLIETVTFGAIYDSFLNGIPSNAMIFASGLFLISGLISFSLFKDNSNV
jgi:hypothetical protein